MSLTIHNPDFAGRIRRRFAATGTMATLGSRLVRTGPGELMIARGRVIRAGRTLIVCEADGVVPLAGSEKCVARMTATMMAVNCAGLARKDNDEV